MSDETLAEDTDVTMALCRAGWRVVYEERAKAWTEAPTTLEQLYRQRYRWSYGTMQAMWKHRRALSDHGDSGRFGRRRAAVPGAVRRRAAAARAGGRHHGRVRPGVLGPRRDGDRLVRHAGPAAAHRGGRVPLRPRADATAVAPAAAAVRLPAADVPGADPVRDHGPDRRPAALAQAAARRSGAGPARCRGPDPGAEHRAAGGHLAAPPGARRPAAGHPAAGRAVARSAVPPQPISDTFVDLQNVPSAGSPPGGGSGPVYTG